MVGSRFVPSASARPYICIDLIEPLQVVSLTAAELQQVQAEHMPWLLEKCALIIFCYVPLRIQFHSLLYIRPTIKGTMDEVVYDEKVYKHSNLIQNLICYNK